LEVIRASFHADRLYLIMALMAAQSKWAFSGSAQTATTSTSRDKPGRRCRRGDRQRRAIDARDGLRVSPKAMVGAATVATGGTPSAKAAGRRGARIAVVVVGEEPAAGLRAATSGERCAGREQSGQKGETGGAPQRIAVGRALTVVSAAADRPFSLHLIAGCWHVGY
jgi:hypothetical protein